MARKSLHARVIESVLQTVKSISDINRVWIAYSGGIDSHVLLHVLAMHRHEIPGLDVRAVYINHGLNPQADQWSQHCQRVCEGLKLDFIAIDVDATPVPGESPEARARLARYSALEKLVQHDQILLTAYHQDDQVETLLLQLMRGSGPKGLAAMPEQTPIGAGALVRPMLNIRREDVHAYAIHHKLNWIVDDSNADLKFDRNYIRHKVIPVLSQRWPSLSQTVSRSAYLCAEASELLELTAAKTLQQVRTDNPAVLDLAVLKMFSQTEQRNALRFWINQLGFDTPSRVQLQRIIDEVLPAREDKLPLVSWGNNEIRRYRDRIYLLRTLPEINHQQTYHWSGADQQSIDTLGVLQVARTSGEGVLAELLEPGRVTIRFRTGGESLKPAGRKEHHSLKKLFQELGIPPWMRGRIPLIFIDDNLAAVESVFVDHNYQARDGKEGRVFHWTPANH